MSCLDLDNPGSFGRDAFADADPVLNQQLNEYEESVFSGSATDELVPLANLIRKTEEQGDLYDTVSFGNQTVSYLRPFLFTLQPVPDHPSWPLAATGCVEGEVASGVTC